MLCPTPMSRGIHPERHQYGSLSTPAIMGMGGYCHEGRKWLSEDVLRRSNSPYPGREKPNLPAQSISPVLLFRELRGGKREQCDDSKFSCFSTPLKFVGLLK